MRRDRTHDDKKPTTPRYGLQALYSFTPFKLLRAERGDRYAILLVETYHHEVANLPRWRSESVKDEFVFRVPAGFPKKIVQPYELYPTPFRSGQAERYEFKARRNLKERWRYFPMYMEFSSEALREARYCAFGWVLLSSKQDDCPIARDCPARTGTPCKYYLGPMSYTRLYNVYPLLRKKYELPPDRRENRPLAAIRYGSMPLVTLTYIPNGSYVAFIDGVHFSPKVASLLRRPLLFLKEGLGFRITRAPAIEFEFNSETLRELIRDRLNANWTLARWIELKRQLYLGKDHATGHVREGAGYAAFERLDDVVKLALSARIERSDRAQTTIKSVNDAKVDDDLINFASFLFIHSFSHLFLNWISARYGHSKADFGYYVEHDIIQTPGLQTTVARAYVFEAAIGGLGYLRSFAEDPLKARSALAEFLGSENEGILAVLRFCERRSDEAIRNLPTELNNFRRGQQEVNRLVDAILAAYTRCFDDPRIYPHVNSIRRAIAEQVPMTSQTRDLMDDLLERVPHCWDGCQLCVMLEQGCNYPPFDQQFLVTSRLTSDLVKVLRSMVDSPAQVFPLRIGVYREFQRFVATAKYSIDLVSPWLSPDVVQTIDDKAKEDKVEVRIITTKDISNEAHNESLRILKNATNLIKTRISQTLHAKGMLIDGVMLLTGSFNFTYSGLKSNVENLTVDFSFQGTSNFMGQFEALWSKSPPLD